MKKLYRKLDVNANFHPLFLVHVPNISDKLGNCYINPSFFCFPPAQFSGSIVTPENSAMGSTQDENK